MPQVRHLIVGEVVKVQKAGALVGVRTAVNLIQGANVTLTVADDAPNDRVNVTVAASGSGGVSTFNTRSGAVVLTEADLEGALTGISFAASQVEIGTKKVLGTRQAAITDLGVGFTSAQARTAVNGILGAMRAHGLIEP